MVLTCHRCGADLPGDDVRGFCPNCGAPQLRVWASLPEEAEPRETTGAAPPPLPRSILWPVAMRCGALVAAAVALFFALALAVPALGLLSLLLIFGASFLAVGLYRRRTPVSLMTPGIGARIGLSTGLLTLAALAITLSVALVGARYRTRAMSGFDAQWTLQMQELIERTNATTPVPPEAARAMTTPEFRAASMLSAMSVFAVFLLGISTGSGAFAGSIAGRPKSGV